MLTAITREPSPAITRCQLSFLEREPIDFELARKQHRDYEDLLRELGVNVERLPAEPDLPDAVFIEDTAVAVDELAVMTSPPSESRRAEVPSVACVLEKYRSLRWIEEQAHLEGGDVLRVVGRCTSESPGAPTRQERNV
jgi:dimethylargininase